MKEFGVPFFTVQDRIEEKLLAERRIFLSESVSNESAREIIRKLWYLELENSNQPIVLVINSPGGSVDAGLAIWDQIKMLKSPLVTLVSGLAASMGSILSLAASQGKRFATPNARIMIHQPAIHGVVEGQATDLKIQADEIVKTRKRLIQFYVNATGKDFETIQRDIDRDKWMTPQEALDYNLIDKVIHDFSEI